MNKIIRFFLFVLGIALFVYGISLIPLNGSLDIFSSEILSQNTTKSYLILGLGFFITFYSLVKMINMKV
jgi:uncharacterized membrane protein